MADYPPSTNEWLDDLSNQLMPTEEEHQQAIIETNNAIRKEIIESGPITGPELIARAMQTSSLYETIAYGFMAMQSFDKLHSNKNVPMDVIEVFKKNLKELLNSKIPGVFT